MASLPSPGVIVSPIVSSDVVAISADDLDDVGEDGCLLSWIMDASVKEGVFEDVLATASASSGAAVLAIVIIVVLLSLVVLADVVVVVVSVVEAEEEGGGSGGRTSVEGVGVGAGFSDVVSCFVC